jgi:putative FmdB family regulatory protein
MPIYEYLCKNCGKTCEILMTSVTKQPECPWCASISLKKLLSAHAAISGSATSGLPGPGDTACCGASPSHASCAGPGSCCGKLH